MIITVDTLPVALQRIGVGSADVSIGSRANMRWCLVEDAPGRWSVFFRERGSDFDVTTFDSEETACYHLLGRMILQQLSRGAIGSQP